MADVRRLLLRPRPLFCCVAVVSILLNLRFAFRQHALAYKHSPSLQPQPPQPPPSPPRSPRHRSSSFEPAQSASLRAAAEANDPNPREMASLLRGAPCVELSALAPCLPGLRGLVVWPNSSDWACATLGIQQLARCPALPAAQPSVDWRAVAFGVPIHESQLEEQLLLAARDTWLGLVDGAEVLISTDLDDTRADTTLAALASAPGVTVHVSRCPVCCSGGKATPGKLVEKPAVRNSSSASGACAAVGAAVGQVLREGWAARAKVLHMLAAMAQLRWASPKLYFFKLDARAVRIQPASAAASAVSMSLRWPLYVG
jgi:hypothetical protein